MLGLLREDGSEAAGMLRTRGVDLPAARAAMGRLAAMALQLAGEQARTLGAGEVGPELLLEVVMDVQARRPRCMSNRWMRRLHASVGLPEGSRGAAGPLLEVLGVDPAEPRQAIVAGLRGVTA